jgi:type IX secretion system PorP/SprF family membrane protein
MLQTQIKSIMKKITIILVLSLIVKASIAQDQPFSQYSASLMTFNPALIGSNLETDNRVSLISKNQWWGTQSYVTNTVGLERKIFPNKYKDNQLTLGLMMLNERSNGGVLSNSYFNAAIADKVRISEQGALKGALSFTYANKLIDLSGATFGSQFGSFGFTNSANNFDPAGGATIKYIDINLGLAYEHTSEQFDYEIGAAVFHANRPKEGLMSNSNYHLEPRAVAHASLVWRPSAEYELLLTGNVQSIAAKKSTTIGGAYTYKLNDEAGHRLTIGIWDRLDEYVSPYAALQIKDFKFGLSYDVASSKIKSTSKSLSSIEASLIWSFGHKKNK